jgi:hypothetical protein
MDRMTLRMSIIAIESLRNDQLFPAYCAVFRQTASGCSR